MSQRSTTPIMYSDSTVRRKSPPIEKTLECTLEEVCHGCLKKIKITRDVLTNIRRIIVQEEEVLRIKVKPGWKQGTKITLEGMSERASTLPADITFFITEKQHHLFKRDSDELLLEIGDTLSEGSLVAPYPSLYWRGRR
ncbi:hypothetical protein HHK36_030421 [Tetracentron sinense]|uniref:Chaperone DnaJ C-terminal domain-containing protein n=1 Tax=Tetracentron sinense TaxID=13715 RepID=A0A834YCU0_TETSI|nr:hypothetical protein HHK36_030421 [Tetracentron sinense]